MKDQVHEFIPETPDQITAQWLTQVLTEGGWLDHAQVTSVFQSRLGEGQGMVGDLIRLELQFDRPTRCPSRLIAKLPKLANRAMGELLGAYERESLFYECLSETIAVRVPQLYYSAFDRDAGSEKQKAVIGQANKMPAVLHAPMNQLARWIASRKNRRYILLIEDLGHASPCDQLAGLSRETCIRVLRNIARLHACYWQSAAPDEHFWLLPFDIDARLRHNMMRSSQPAFRQSFTAVLDAGLEPFAQAVAERGVELCAQLARAPTTLLHNDLRADNLLLDGEEVVFIDWQLTRQGPGAYDVAYLLSSALLDDTSAQDLLAAYHQALCDEGVRGYSFEQLAQDYQSSLLVVLMNLSTVDQVKVETDRGRRMLEVWIERLHLRLQADAA